MKFRDLVVYEYRFEVSLQEGLLHISGQKEDFFRDEESDLPPYCSAPKARSSSVLETMDEIDLESALEDANAPWCPHCRAGFLQWYAEKEEALEAYCRSQALAEKLYREANP